MSRIFLFLLLLGTLSCKKDLLQVRQVRRIDAGISARLNKVIFFDRQTGLCVGGNRFDNSRLLRTTDGGQTWTSISVPEAPKEMFGITRSAAGRIYVIGFDGKLLYSDDTGGSWIFRQLRFEAYKVIAMRSPENPVAIGGITFDRGDVMELNRDGELQEHTELDYELNDIHFGAGGKAYRCGFGALQWSADSGRNWTWTQYKNDNYSALEVLGNRVWVCGREGSIIRSLDGGASWERLRNGTDIGEKKYRLNDIAFRNADEGFAVGESGAVLYSRDAGAHWSQIEPFTSAHLQGLTIHPDGRIFVCGGGGELWELRY